MKADRNARSAGRSHDEGGVPANDTHGGVSSYSFEPASSAQLGSGLKPRNRVHFLECGDFVSTAYCSILFSCVLARLDSLLRLLCSSALFARSLRRSTTGITRFKPGTIPSTLWLFLHCAWAQRIPLCASSLNPNCLVWLQVVSSLAVYRSTSSLRHLVSLYCLLMRQVPLCSRCASRNLQ